MAGATLERKLDRQAIAEAHSLIKSHIHRTPVLTSTALNTIVSAPQSPETLKGTEWEGHRPAKPKFNLFFKCENFQKVGAFKIRGASHALSRLSPEELKRGVITHSSGNHAQALALAAKRFGTTAHIIMPTISTPLKIEATKGYGAQVYFSGSTAAERESLAHEIQQRTGAILIPPYDHPDIILGQGTMALELEEQVHELLEDADTSQQSRTKPLDAVIAPLGGGGMLGGIATYFCSTPASKERTLVFGAEPSYQGANDAVRALASSDRKRISHVSSLTIADGLRTPVGELNWQIVSDEDLVAGVYSVSETQIAAALKLIFQRLKVFVEPSAAVGLAVCLFDEDFRARVEREGGEGGWDVGVVLSGGNTSVEALAEIFGSAGAEEAMGREQRKVGLDGTKVAEDVPG